MSNDGTQIVGMTVIAVPAGSCKVPIPLTMPGPVQSTNGQTTEQIGNDPLTIWVDISQGSQTFLLQTPIAVSATYVFPPKV